MAWALTMFVYALCGVIMTLMKWKIMAPIYLTHQKGKRIMKTDVIGGFTYADPNCTGCRNPLLLENAWMTDGCPCNCELGVNSMNETRWRLLMELQQKQSLALQRCEALVQEWFKPQYQHGGIYGQELRAALRLDQPTRCAGVIEP